MTNQCSYWYVEEPFYSYKGMLRIVVIVATRYNKRMSFKVTKYNVSLIGMLVGIGLIGLLPILSSIGAIHYLPYWPTTFLLFPSKLTKYERKSLFIRISTFSVIHTKNTQSRLLDHIATQNRICAPRITTANWSSSDFICRLVLIFSCIPPCPRINSRYSCKWD